MKLLLLRCKDEILARTACISLNITFPYHHHWFVRISYLHIHVERSVVPTFSNIHVTYCYLWMRYKVELDYVASDHFCEHISSQIEFL
jgi:hypothetical protein